MLTTWVFPLVCFLAGFSSARMLAACSTIEPDFWQLTDSSLDSVKNKKNKKLFQWV